MNPLLRLLKFGQGYWIDNLTRHMIISGNLKRRVDKQGLRGVTSNPKIFHEAIAKSDDYDAQIETLIAEDRSNIEIYEALVTTDIRDACDILRPLYDELKGQDGFVSLEVSPHLAHDTQGSLQEARRLWQIVDRPNLLIKIPATTAGIPAIEELLFEGININITLLFSIERYQAVAQAYLKALERRLEAGKPVAHIASVASFFLSRIDVLVDQLLSHRIPLPGRSHLEPHPEDLQGKVAIANAKLAYQHFKQILQSDCWQALEAKGAQMQRMLWASTNTKNPAYRDVMYIEPLIGPHTINTMPEDTIEAFADHGRVKETVEENIEEAQKIITELEKIGIDFHFVASQLENEGIQKFIEPYDALLEALGTKCQQRRNRQQVKPLQEVAQQLRRLVIQMTTDAGSGHPTSCLSCAEIVAALFFHEMHWDPRAPKARNVDTFILSKGHAAPILWAALWEAKAIDEDPLSLRKLDSTLEGHPTPNNPWIKVATGSLGQGLAAANGIALANRLDNIHARVYCLLGDGECSEGSVWEAAQFASLNKLSDLVAIVDVNALAQSGPAPYQHDTPVFAHRFQSFGWETIEIDGHDLAAILNAFEQAKKTGPTAIIAKTEKGKGVSFLEGKDGWHGKALDPASMEKALAELGENQANVIVEPRRIGTYIPPQRKPAPALSIGYSIGDEIATRDAFGKALKKLGDFLPELVVLDGDVKNSTRTEYFSEEYPNRFFESYIAEQNMVGTALGLAVCGKISCAASFACFLTRAYDFIRMAGHSRPPHLIFCGSHAGVSIGEDGPSQMGLEDLAMFRAVSGSTVLYPCDGVSAERLTAQATQTQGIVYIRTTRPKTPVIYTTDEKFPIGGSKILRTSKEDKFTLVTAGITVHEALAAYDRLKQKGISTRIIDSYSVKPLDVETLSKAAHETQALFVIEDHWIEGGLGDAVAAAVNSPTPVYRLAITEEPRSGKSEELLERYGISQKAITQKILEFMG
ncbi:transketolase [Nitrosococcus wardiae]|uniref:Transaldolase n=1 Tax=Nitrosococcus wardiae TaxID=1814290 RepID=A0A4V1AW79_9GAMM|nr:transketolase [Nitrosococcus wardiae]QBQ55695.1 transketolase [Nitrosococcus wardiae]